jgi:hypothetical protein
MNITNADNRRFFIFDFILKNDIKSMGDLGCGDGRLIQYLIRSDQRTCELFVGNF